MSCLWRRPHDRVLKSAFAQQLTRNLCISPTACKEENSSHNHLSLAADPPLGMDPPLPPLNPQIRESPQVAYPARPCVRLMTNKNCKIINMHCLPLSLRENWFRNGQFKHHLITNKVYILSFYILNHSFFFQSTFIICYVSDTTLVTDMLNYHQRMTFLKTRRMTFL